MKNVLYYSTLALIMLFNLSGISQPVFFQVTIENVGNTFPFTQSGAFSIPVDSAAAGPAFPGAAYEFSFDAIPGSKLSFATMFVQSNDLFYAPGEMGIALYDTAGNPISGDITDQVDLWDSGTELNEVPGTGPNQAPRQAGPDAGDPDTITTVRLVNDEFTYPEDDSVIQVILTHNGGTSFTVRIENISTAETLVLPDSSTVGIPLSPGVFVIHTEDAPLFTVGEADRGEGLEAIAEDGDATVLAASLDTMTGATPILSPGVFAVHNTDNPLFTVGEDDRGQGLEAIAEDGAAGALAALLQASDTISGDAFAVPTGASAPGPILPGGSYTFKIVADSGASLSLATMFVQSNDLFYAPDGAGIPLFNADGSPVSGDITSFIDLWDAGTELNEIPGIGLNQAPRQAGPDTGAVDTITAVRLVNDGFMYPSDEDVIRVTIDTLPATTFTVRINNVSNASTLSTGDGSVAVPLSPGAWAVHTTNAPLFTVGEQDRGVGIEEIAEDGNGGPLGDFIDGKPGIIGATFAIPVDSAAPGPIFPGASYEFTITAAPGAKLSLATMFVQSNDLFFAPEEMGIALFDSAGNPISGDVTDQVLLWDSGTELNEEPGIGLNQAPRQTGPDEGEIDPDSTVRFVNDTFTYPPNDSVISVIINPATSTSVNELIPGQSALLNLIAYPNPFTSSTTIRFNIERNMRAGIDVYNLMGQKVDEIAPVKDIPAGIHEIQWDGASNKGVKVNPGIYLIQFHAVGEGTSHMLINKQ